MKALRRSVAALLLPLTVGCTAVRPIATPAAFIPQHNPDRVWVAAPNGEIFQLLSPSMRGDSVVGTLAGTSESMTLPIGGDYIVLARQPSSGRTAQLVGVVGAVGGLAVWGFITGGNGAKGCATPGSRGCPPQ